MEQERLMGEKYFISPNYKGNMQGEFGIYAPKVDKNKDILEEWLRINSIFFGQGGFAGDRTKNNGYSERRLFMGLNGVLCEIKDVRVTKEEKNEDEVYSRVVRVRYIPIDKNIPSELTTKLEELEYREPLEEDSQIIGKANWEFSNNI